MWKTMIPMTMKITQMFMYHLTHPCWNCRGEYNIIYAHPETFLLMFRAQYRIQVRLGLCPVFHHFFFFSEMVASRNTPSPPFQELEVFSSVPSGFHHIFGDKSLLSLNGPLTAFSINALRVHFFLRLFHFCLLTI